MSSLSKLVGPFRVLVLAGVYGMMSQAVSRHTHELAVRMALGAGSGDVLRLVLRQGLRTTLAGLILGLAGAVAATRVLAGFLYQVNTFDAAMFVGVSSAVVAMLPVWYRPCGRRGYSRARRHRTSEDSIR